MSQVLSSSLTAVNQMFLTNNKTDTSGYFGTVTVNTQPGFYLFQGNNRNTKNNETRTKMRLNLTVRIPERRQ